MPPGKHHWGKIEEKETKTVPRSEIREPNKGHHEQNGGAVF
jgi:hypothetical protein